MLFYRYVFHLEELNPAEGIVYSALISQSLMSNPEFFNLEGKFQTEAVRDYLSDNNEFIDCPEINISKLAKQVEMARNSTKKCVDSLKLKGFLVANCYLKLPLQVFNAGYYNIPANTGLSGQQLVFYGFIHDQASHFGGSTGTWTSKLAKDTNISEHNAHCIISILHKKGLVERLPNGRLKVL